MNWILALFPFSEDSHNQYEDGHSYELINGEWKRVHWHLVIADKWINLGFDLPYWCKFSIGNLDNGEFCVRRYFGWGLEEDNEGDYPNSFKVYRLPWHTEAFKQGVLINDEWIDFPCDRNSFETWQKMKKQADRKTYTFNAYGGKIKATCWAERYLDAIYWFPEWLKELFYTKREHLQIEFSDEIGRGRGSWKGGTLGLPTDFVGNIRDSWYKFKKEVLPDYLRSKK